MCRKTSMRQTARGMTQPLRRRCWHAQRQSIDIHGGTNAKTKGGGKFVILRVIRKFFLKVPNTTFDQ